jgi:hypothetical protein
LARLLYVRSETLNPTTYK